MAETAAQAIDGGLKDVLAKLKEAGIESAAVVRRDGVVIEAAMAGSEEEKEAFAAMAAAMLGAAETTISELKQGVPRRVIVEMGDRRLIEVGAGPVALLVATVGPGIALAQALKAIDGAARDVRGIVKASPPAE